MLNYLDTARLWLTGVVTKIDTVSPTLMYIWTYNSVWSLADTSKPWRKIQRIQTVGTVQTIDFPMDSTSLKYQEWGHIRDDRSTLNRQ